MTACRLLLIALALGALSAGCTQSTVTCDAPFTACTATICANLDADPQHCGDCGTSCATGQSCVLGVCACPAGTTPCNGICVSLDNDTENCGACGNSCQDQVCINGTCGCFTPFTSCSATVCANLDSDSLHCGSCDRACANGQSCIAGDCACAQGQSMVNGTCAATVFAACFNTGEVVALDDDLNPQASRVLVGAGPQSIGFGGGRILVADAMDNVLYRLDPQASPVTKEAGGDGLDKAANQLLVRGDRAYVVSSLDNVVQVIDLTKAAPLDISDARSIDEIPTSAAEPLAPENTNPSFAAFAGDKLYVTLLGTCDASGDAAGNRLLELDVSTVPGKATRELVFNANDYLKDSGAAANSPRPAGLAAVGTRLFVAIGNLNPGCVGTAGPGYLAVVDTAADPMTSQAIQLPDECRNPGFVLASADRVYVSCGGTYGPDWLPQDRQAVVVLDPTADPVALVKTVTFATCADRAETGPAACKVVVPGRLALHGQKLLIADNNAGRLMVTDLDGNMVPGFESGVSLCPLSCPMGDSSQVCSQYTSDVFATR
ncbi:MAG: hypothetical protein HY901_12140 [Deltaproteobacteria bacterium]|nr:hypothetical protein [Deltaproteobacteria bacterium]